MAILLATSTDLRELFDASPFPAILSRLADDVVIAVNRKALEIVRVSASDVVGRKVTDFYINPEERSLLVERLRRDGRADDILLQVANPPARTRWLRASSSMVSVDGEPTVLSVFNDVTVQVNAEQSLRASEQRLAAQSEALTTLTAQETAGTLLRDAARGVARGGGADAPCGAGQHVAVRRRRGVPAVRLICTSGLPGGTRRATCFCGNRARCISKRSRDGRIAATLTATSAPEFAGSYLQPHGIAPCWTCRCASATTTKACCAWNISAPRDWTVDERNFALSVANLVSAAIAGEQRSRQCRGSPKTRRVRLVLDTAHDAFVGMHADGKVVAWNLQAAAMFGYSREGHRPAARRIDHPGGHARRAHARARRSCRRRRPDLNRRLELTALHRDGHEFPSKSR
jgi:PAS domain S-box-containing protein